MTTTPELNHETFNLLDMLAGRTYPEDTVDVFLDAKTAYLIAKSNEEVGRLRANKQNDEAQELEKAVEALVEESSKAKLTLHIRAIPMEVREALLKKAFEEFPEERDFVGRVRESRERDKHYTRLLWEAHILSVETAQGTDHDITLEKVSAMRKGGIPEQGVDDIASAIKDLYAGTAAGFEQAAQETAFSSAA